MDRDEIETFLKLQSKLASTHEEISLLSKKSPNDAVNKFKLRFINTILLEANDILGDEYRPFDEFESFAEDDLPTNSDVVFIVAPYLGTLEKLRCDNIAWESGQWSWQVDGKAASDLRTNQPTIR